MIIKAYSYDRPLRMLEAKEQDPILRARLNRREFLKWSLRLSEALLAGTYLFREESREPYETNLFSVDFAPSSRIVSFLYGITQPYYPDNRLITRDVLRKNYASPEAVYASALPGFIADTVRNLPQTIFEDHETRRARFTEHALRSRPLAAVPQLLLGKFASHGREMTENRAKILRRLGLKTDRNVVIPVQAAVEVVTEHGSPVIFDELGNPGVGFYFNPHVMAKHINYYAPRLAPGKRILQLPLQVGEVEAYSVFRDFDPDDPTQVIEVEPSIKIVGAYDEKKAYENLFLLTEFVKMIDVDLVVARREDSSAITQRGDAGQCAACL
ncbi:MAG TPA: hypothetical protein VJL83_05390 [Patescibacteria group bacterium]|nr:hypothetical protein [Patescibacteria group bacterium]